REWTFHGSAWMRCAALANGILFGPIAEEVLFRGILYGTLRSRWNAAGASFLSSALFAFLHFYSLQGFLTVFFFGLCTAFVYERTRSLPACIIGHGLVNFAIFGRQMVEMN